MFVCVCVRFILSFSDNPQQTSRVPVYIRVLDVNDNPPALASFYETFVCESAKSSQVKSVILPDVHAFLLTGRPPCQFSDKKLRDERGLSNAARPPDGDRDLRRVFRPRRIRRRDLFFFCHA